jgi:hypothetical protein
MMGKRFAGVPVCTDRVSEEICKANTERGERRYERPLWLTIIGPLPLGFVEVFILQGDKALCFDTLSQVFILEGLRELLWDSMARFRGGIARRTP